MSDPGLVTVTLTRHREPNDLVLRVLTGLAAQRRARLIVLFLDQMDDPETAEKCRDLTNERISLQYIRIPERSLCFARNLAIEGCETDVLLFLDADAVPHPDWAYQLGSTLTSTGAAVAGGKILPRWHRSPLLLSRSRLVLEQFSLLDLGEGVQRADKVVGANMGLNLKRLGKVAQFDESLGRRAGRLISGEETELCDRARARRLPIFYNGQAVVEHQIRPERVRYSWLMQRFYHAGLNRGRRGGAPRPTHPLRSLWDIVAMAVFSAPYVSGYLRGVLLRYRSG